MSNPNAQNTTKTLRIELPPAGSLEENTGAAGGTTSAASPLYGGISPTTPLYGNTAAGGINPTSPTTPLYGGITPTTPLYGANMPGNTSNARKSPSPPLPLPSGEVKLHTSNPNTLLSRKILDTYFQTFDYPFTRHHIDSFDQLLAQDIPAIIKANNPILILNELIPGSETYIYRTEVFIGGLNGDEIEIGTPTLSLQKAKEVRVLFPNEARLRNLTYASSVYANVLVRVTITLPGQEPLEPQVREYKRMPLFQIPILLHSRYCLLHGKPESFLKEAGECPQDQGGYFVVDGAEKVLVTRQEQAFNTFYVQKQPNDDKIETYGNITCLNPETRQVKVVTFYWMRATDTLAVVLPYVRKPIPVFTLFRAMGVQADEDILKLIYPDLNSAEARQAIPILLHSIAESYPFLDSYSAVQYIKTMTKGFSVDHVYDILFNQTFIHITDKKGGSRVHFLADCVRKFMRVHMGVDPNADRDDTRNQRCLTSGQLIRMLFNNAYVNWRKAVRLAIDSEYSYSTSTYEGMKFMNIFSEGNTQKLFIEPGKSEKNPESTAVTITSGIMRGFKGKWVTGGAGGGGSMGHSDEKSGVLQAMSRLSYLDFMSHTRRVILNFDTGMKLTKPRQLHGSQYGYFCTNETPSGGSIGISKNLSLMTLISNAGNPAPIVNMLIERGWIIPCSDMRTDLQILAVPFFLNNGIVGYTLQPDALMNVLKHMKWTGCLPALSSTGFSIRNRRVFLYVDDGRPTRPLIHLEGGRLPREILESAKTWRELVLGSLAQTRDVGISTTSFTDIFADRRGTIPMDEYVDALKPHIGVIEYVDPYEQNEAFIVNFPEHITEEASHIEIHPCTIVSVVNGMIPFANYNQSPRNQLSCSQSKQSLGMYATNFQNRYDNTANILSYGEAPLVRTLQYDVLGQGQMPYGHNLIMAIMPFQGYNQDDGIVFNEDAFQRGMFRNINYRSYQTFEETDRMTKTKSIVANPLRVPSWTDLRPGKDYTKLDERGIIKVGEIVDENTVLVGKYIQDKNGGYKDASLTPQVWTSGRVESVVVTVNNKDNIMVKVRITQDRTPELGDKFSTRHGQKGTIGMRFRAHDLPRTADGLVPDMLVNPHCIPSRMTVAQLMEMLFGEVCYQNSMIGDATVFMSDAQAPEAIGRVLESQFGFEKTGNHVLYDGASGVQMATTVFMGPVFTMRLKHMVEDKWNARAEGRKEQRTHQPTGGRGAQGGLRIGEMERDALAGHGVARFLRESIMERSDKTLFRVCNGCGTVPIFNDRQNLFICSLCDGPVQFIGTTAQNMEILPTVKRSLVTTSLVEMPYATKLLADELGTFMNMGIRVLTANGLSGLKDPTDDTLPEGLSIKNALAQPLPNLVLPETRVPEYRDVPEEEVVPSEENLYAMGVLQRPGDVEDMGAEGDEEEAVLQAYGNTGLFENQKGRLYDPMRQPIQPGSANEAEARQMIAAPAPAPAPAAPTYAPMTPPVYAQNAPAAPGYAPMTPPVYAAATALAAPGYAPMTPPGYAQTTPPGYGPMTPPGAPQIPYYTQQAPANPSVGQVLVGGMPQILQGGGGSYVIPQPIVYQSPLPQMQQSPTTIVIDTGPQAMEASGYQESMQAAARGIPVMGSGQAGGRRHTTPRARPMSPRRGPASVGGYTAGAKITINKLG
jgi:DNA-directed RNA polymerase II subunit RPB2